MKTSEGVHADLSGKSFEATSILRAAWNAGNRRCFRTPLGLSDVPLSRTRFGQRGFQGEIPPTRGPCPFSPTLDPEKHEKLDRGGESAVGRMSPSHPQPAGGHKVQVREGVVAPSRRRGLERIVGVHLGSAGFFDNRPHTRPGTRRRHHSVPGRHQFEHVALLRRGHHHRRCLDGGQRSRNRQPEFDPEANTGSAASAGPTPVGLGVNSRTNPRAASTRQVPGRLVSKAVLVV